MASNFKEFTREVSAAGRDIPAREIVRLQRQITLDAIRRIVARTPEDAGETASLWQVTIGAPAATAGPSGGDPIAGAAAALAALGPFVVTFVSNPTPQAVVLEYGLFRPPNPGPSEDPRPGRKGRVLVQGGFSVQAPQGMVSVTVQELIGRYGR